MYLGGKAYGERLEMLGKKLSSINEVWQAILCREGCKLKAIKCCTYVQN